ncbi:NupC/NupG family nucleoside CNT transporter [Ruania albidiflava]|uniref:NupC/NupG family nucleoside CNT transporter n=1 Tax=Ruania albidiflava TaxID=366586 RepID=UPI0023F14608|nr:nucleoside transporter C-terminal domain-containing protein [Ruania albidiflava]
MIDLLWGLGGMLVLLSLAVLLSVDRRKIRVRTVGLALAAQLLIGVVVLYVPWGATALNAVSSTVQAVIDTSADGIEFLFGPVLPDEGSVFAFQVLPVIVFFASLTAVLYHLNVLQWVVRIIGGALAKILGTTRPESMNAAANIFVGQTEAPLVIRPYVKAMTRSELFAVMVGGLSTVAGSVLVGYSLLGARLDYLIAASFMAAPGALAMAKLLVPAGALQEAAETPSGHRAVPEEVAEASALGGQRYRRRTATTTATGTGATGTDAAEADSTDAARAPASRAETDAATGRPAAADTPADEDEPGEARNVIDAAARGAADGLTLALNVGAMLLAFISLIALGNLLLGVVSGWFGAELTIEQVFGYVFAPVMFLVGTPWPEALEAGSFLGQKVVLNEFVAFSDFAPRAGEFSAKTQAVVTFALTGFANLGSIAILLGGLGGIAPSRRGDIAQLGVRAVLAGTLANLMSAAIVGMLIG